MRLHDGRVDTPRMRWQQGDSFAEFSASTDVAGLRGRLDIDAASLVWQSADGLPSWLQQAGLHGRFAHTDMQWEGNAWKDMRGSYAMRESGLLLEHVAGRLADGGIHSRRMHIESVPGGLRIAGRLTMTAVHLEHLHGLADTLGVNPAGYLFFNARLAGTLPAGLKGVQNAGWSGNGDVEIQHGSFDRPMPGNEILLQHPAASGLAGDVASGFDKLVAHFQIRKARLHVSHVQLSTANVTLKGDASVAANGTIAGRLDVQRGKQSAQTLLTGSWPAWGRLF